MQTAEIFASELDYAKQKIAERFVVAGTEPSLLFRELARTSKYPRFSVWHRTQLDDIIATALVRSRHITCSRKRSGARELNRLSRQSACCVAGDTKILREWRCRSWFL